MPFQPFGYRFDIYSPLAPTDFKAVVRSEKKPWLHVKDGPRGWIVGRVICLWFSAFDRHGPMLFGVISEDPSGTRVSGRAGSDLNGVAMFTLLIPFMGFLVLRMIGDGSASARQLLVISIVMLVGGPFLYWVAHKDRRDAEPLVRFLKSKTSAGGSLKSFPADNIISGFTLVSGDEARTTLVTPAIIHEALLGLGTGDILVLQSGPETYIQTVSRDGGYIIEKREGGRLRHFAASRPGSSSQDETDSSETVFTFEEAVFAFVAFGKGTAAPSFLKWEPLRLPD